MDRLSIICAFKEFLKKIDLKLKSAETVPGTGFKSYRKGPEAPHVDVNRLVGSGLKKKKYFL